VVEIGEVRMDDLHSYVERTFRHVAESKTVEFIVEMDAALPKSMFTDAKRLQQVLKNLLSNAFKFTHHGHVKLAIEPAYLGAIGEGQDLSGAAPAMLSFSVTDTGIGIPSDKQQIIFEAFQQADGSTSRKYGGTGLGLAISRELSKLLGGEIRLVSSPGRGSTFTLLLPRVYSPPRQKFSSGGGVRRGELASGLEGLARAGEAGGGHGLRLVDPESGTGGPELGRWSGEVNGAIIEVGGATNAYELSGVSAVADDEALVGPLVNEVGDDRDAIQPGDRVILIVENDQAFAKFLLDASRDRGFKGLVTSLGAAALAMAREYSPDAITLDIFLPDIEGWRVLNRLKNDVHTRHVPVCVISTDEARTRALLAGAVAFVAKPIQSRDTVDALLEGLMEFIGGPNDEGAARERIEAAGAERASGRSSRRVLIVEPDEARRHEILALLMGESVEGEGAEAGVYSPEQSWLPDAEAWALGRSQSAHAVEPSICVHCVSDGEAALAALESPEGEFFNCLVVNPAVTDLSPHALAERLAQVSDAPNHFWHVPVILYGEQNEAQTAEWNQLSDVATVHRIASPKRLLDQVMLFLHRNVRGLTMEQQQVLRELHESDKLLAGRKVLIVDDDVRNIFALATVLEDHDMVIASADNGRTAIQMLQEAHDIDIVLMDIMMPEMDGIDTMREIRKMAHLRNLPIIAVTAKAMKGDREKCIEAGAWDYLAKPVDTEQLLAVMRAWLHR